MGVRVLIAPEAQGDLDDLPATILGRVNTVIERLKQWPEVAGAKRLRKEWAGHFRIRTGDWRVIFREVSQDVLVVRVRHRKDVYED